MNEFLKRAGGKASDVQTVSPMQSPQMSQQEGGGVGSFLKEAYQGIAGPVANMIARPAQAIQHAGLIPGQDKEAPIEGKFLGLDITDPYADVSRGASPAKTVLKDVGRGIETVSLGVGGGGAVNTAKAGIRAGITQGIKRGVIEGVKSGVLIGEGKSLEEGNTDVGTIAKDTVKGAVVGGLTGGVIGGSIPATRAVISAAKPIARVAGRALKGAGESAYGLTVTPQKATSQMVNTYNASKPSLFSRVKDMLAGDTAGRPITEANTAARTGLMGTEKELGVQAERASNKLWSDVIQPKLDAVKGKVNMKSFLGEVEKDIEKTATGPRKTALREALTAFKDEYKGVSSISLNKLQDYKSAWAELLPESSYSGKPIAGALREVQNIAAQKARQVIYKHIGDEGKQAYLDWGNLQSIIESGVRSTRDPAKRSLGLNMWQMIMDKAITPVATIGGKILYKTGDGLELIGQKGAKNVKGLLGSDAIKFFENNIEKKAIDTFKNTPNKQGGFARIDYEIPKSVNPASAAKLLDETDTIAIDNYLRNPSIENYSSAEPIIKSMKIEGLTEAEQKRFLQEVMDEYSGVADRKVIKK